MRESQNPNRLQSSRFDDVGLFWSWIDEAREQSGGDPERQCEILIERLASAELLDIVRWHQLVEGFSIVAHKNKLWGAAYLMNGGASDDGFDYFKGWLIAQGKDAYRNALADPDSLADLADASGESGFELEEFLGLGYDAYFRKLGIEAPEDSDYESFLAAVDASPLTSEHVHAQFVSIDYIEAMHEDIDENWDEKSLPKYFPRLAALFG